MKLKTTYKILITAFGSILGLSLLLSNIANANAAVINNALGIATTKYEAGSVDPNYDATYFKSKFTKLSDVIANGRAVCQEVEEEGAVLLKNEGNALPLASGNKVSLFGVASIDPVYSGTGSGSVSSADAETLKAGLTAAGLEINGTLDDYYTANKDAYKRSTVKDTTGGYGALKGVEPNGMPWSVVEAGLGNSLSTYGDAAIMTIARVGGEGMDLPTGNSHNSVTTTGNASGDYLALTDNEITVLKGLKALKDAGTIKKIVILINSANALETPFLDEAQYGIDSALWIGATGHKGLSGVGRILTGKVTPSGHLSDTYYTDNATYNPVLANFGDYTYLQGPELVSANGKIPASSLTSFDKYVVYQEGIYLGYRYAETRYEDKVLGRANTGDFVYANAIDYPFGYGLSYTSFDFSDFKVQKKGNDYTVSVKVTNSGATYSGKQVVQVYAQKPYTSYDVENGIEKAAVDLVGFAKTSALAPKASETVSVEVSGRQFASFDANKAKTYVIDAGTYYLTAATSAHEAVNNILTKKGKTTQDGMDKAGDSALVYSDTLSFNDSIYSYKESTKAKIKSLFDFADINKYQNKGDNSVKYLSRNDWSGTYPSSSGASLTANAAMVADMASYLSIASDSVAYPKYGNGTKTLQLVDLIKDSTGTAIPYDSPLWTTLLDELTWDETLQLVSQGMRQTTPISSIGKVGTRDHNGPIGCTEKYGNGVNGLAAKTNDPDKDSSPTCFPCNGILAATFSTDMAKKEGDAIGEDALWAGYSGLYGPCSNIHRSPYEGRCFEYYSEDATLNGFLLGVESQEIEAHGCYVYNKHFALNDQETNRGGVGTWANEQTIRENYLRSFELTIDIGDAKCVMTAMNRMGTVPCYAGKTLIEEYLNTEVGMKGFAVTDYFLTSWDPLEVVLLNGGSLPDGNVSEAALKSFNDAYKENHGQLAQNMREAAHKILFTVAHSNAMNGIAPGGKIVALTPWWKTLLTTTEIVGGIGLGGSVVMLSLLLIGIFPKKKVD
jgi:Beta-glucosidase-related glycosidases